MMHAVEQVEVFSVYSLRIVGVKHITSDFVVTK